MRFTRKGYGKLLRHDGTQVSQHVVPEEAYERAALEGEGSYTWQPAPIAIVVEPHDCEAPAPEPLPAPEPPPAPAPTPAPAPEPAPSPEPSDPVVVVLIGDLAHDGPATPEHVSLILPVDAGLPLDARASVRYHDGLQWREAHPLVRQRPDLSPYAKDALAAPGFAGVISGLQPGASYRIEVTVSVGEARETRTLDWTTRALPAAAGPATVTIHAGAATADIARAINTAKPGDVIEFEPGVYEVNDLQIKCKGTADAPIYVRGRDRNSVILRDPGGKVLHLVGAVHVVLENLTVEGSFTDSGTDAGSSGVWVWNGARHDRITIRDLTIRGVDRGIIVWGEGTQLLVYDNTLEGNNPWAKPVLESNASWNDDGIMAAGSGNAVFNNTLSGFGDAFAVNAGYSNIGVHFYRNRILWTCDDGFEADYGARNLSFHDNIITNAMTLFSCDPLRAGPLFVYRNVAVNIGRQPFKLNSTLAGLFVYSNTVVRQLGMDTIAGTYQPGSSGSVKHRAWAYRNNLFLCLTPGLANTLWWETSGNDPIDCTHNAWWPDARFRWNYSGGNFDSLAEAQAGLRATAPVFSGETQRHAHDIICEPQPFATPISLGPTYDVRVDGDMDATLSPASVARGAGVHIPGITDGYSGAAPDIGAVITGRPAPVIGCRTCLTR